MIDGEQNLIQRAIRGEAPAFGSLYDHYQPKIYRFVLIKVSQREEAEDLTHQVFLNAWQNIKSYKNLGFPFGSWLYQIARNEVIDFYRTRKKSARIEEIDPEALSFDALNQQSAETSMALQKVRTSMLKLKPEQQDVIIMRFVEDLSLKETAAAMGKTEGAIKLLQHRAIDKLKELLKQQS